MLGLGAGPAETRQAELAPHPEASHSVADFR